MLIELFLANLFMAFLRFIGLFLLIGPLLSCAAKLPEPDSLRDSYMQLLRKSELDPVSTQVTTDFQNLITQFEGSRYAALAKLRLAEILAAPLTTFINKASDFDQIDLYFQLFLLQNPGHPLTPYVYVRLLEVAYIKSKAGIFVVGTDPKPYLDILKQTTNFKLLYPDKVYQPEVEFYHRYAQQKLAEYEVSIGDWYFTKKYYAAAAGRYSYVLNHFPYFQDLQGLSVRLIDAYIRNQDYPQANDALASFQQLYNYNPFPAYRPR